MKKFLLIMCPFVICCAVVHRRVIKAYLNGEEMPKAPSWHVWVPEDKRREN